MNLKRYLILIAAFAVFGFAGCKDNEPEEVVLDGTTWKTDHNIQYIIGKGVIEGRGVFVFDDGRKFPSWRGLGDWGIENSEGELLILKTGAQLDYTSLPVYGSKIKFRFSGGDTVTGTITKNKNTMTLYHHHNGIGSATYRRQ